MSENEKPSNRESNFLDLLYAEVTNKNANPSYKIPIASTKQTNSSKNEKIAVAASESQNKTNISSKSPSAAPSKSHAIQSNTNQASDNVSIASDEEKLQDKSKTSKTSKDDKSTKNKENKVRI